MKVLESVTWGEAALVWGFLHQDYHRLAAYKVPGEIKRSRGGRWSWTFKLAQKRSWVGRWSWAAKVGLLSLQVVAQQQCTGHCPCDCPSTAVEITTAQCTSHWAMARGHSLNTFIVLAALHGLSSLFRAVSTVEPSLFHPPLPPSPSLISHLTSVDIKTKRSRLAVMMHGESCLKQSSLELSVCSHSLAPKVIFRSGNQPVYILFTTEYAPWSIFFSFKTTSASASWQPPADLDIWLLHVHIVTEKALSQSHCVPALLCPSLLFPSLIMSQPHCVPAHCVPAPLCPSCIVSQCYCVPVLLCPSPLVSHSHCVPLLLCPSPRHRVIQAFRVTQ